MGIEYETLAAANKYTEDTIIGQGAIKGDKGDPGPQGPKGDTGEGVAAGGSTGQVLIKSSDADHDTEWKSIDGIEVVDNYEKMELSITRGKCLDSNGGWVTTGLDTSTICSITPVTEGEKYHIKGALLYNTVLYALVDSNNQVISVYPSGAGSIMPVQLYDAYITVPSGCVKIWASAYASDVVVEKLKGTKNIIHETHEIDVLWGKKWCACGDSFTAGVTGNTTDPDTGYVKTYPWWITKRHNMAFQNNARMGAKFTNIGSGARFSVAGSDVSYTKIAPDCDYVTLAFGGNEASLTTEQIGTKTDTTNETLWGAYNVVLEAILTANPDVKIGIIINDYYLSNDYYNALTEIAEYWGIPYLDMTGRDFKVPLGINGSNTKNPTAIALRDSVFKLENDHPTDAAQEYRSTFIENFLRSL